MSAGSARRQAFRQEALGLDTGKSGELIRGIQKAFPFFVAPKSRHEATACAARTRAAEIADIHSAKEQPSSLCHVGDALADQIEERVVT
jgi:hypothetical protein